MVSFTGSARGGRAVTHAAGRLPHRHATYMGMGMDMDMDMGMDMDMDMDMDMGLEPRASGRGGQAGRSGGAVRRGG